MATRPLSYIRSAASALPEAGATLVAGHSAHVFHGVAGPILFDLGDFINDYPLDPAARNDLGLLFLVTLGTGEPQRIEAVPLKLGYAHTRIANASERALIKARFTAACAAFGTRITDDDGRLVTSPGNGPSHARH